MKKENGYKNYINYFKKWDGAGPFGIGLMVLGVWLIWMGWQYIPFSYPIAMVLIPLGLVLFFYGNIGRASEADIQNCIEKSEEKIHFNELEEIPALRKRTPKTLTEQKFEGYSLKKGVVFKKLKNGSLCSSEYDVAKMVTLNDGFYIKTLHFSFLSEEQEIVAYDVPFATLESITAERKKKRRGETVPLDVSINLFDDSAEDMKQTRMLQKRISRLGPFDRAIVLLWLEDLSYDEIGSIVGISAKNVSVRLFRIKEQLKKMSDE